MKKSFSLFFSSILIFIFYLNSVCYAVEAAGGVDPYGDMDNLDPDTSGWVNVIVDAETNRPQDFKDYNFCVSFKNIETGYLYEGRILYINDYEANIQIPYGSYFISEIGVINDIKSQFKLVLVEGDEEFTLSDEKVAIDLSFGFYSPDVNTEVTPQESENMPEYINDIKDDSMETPSPNYSQNSAADNPSDVGTVDPSNEKDSNDTK